MPLEFPLPPSSKDPDTLEPWAKEYTLDPGRSPRVVTATIVDGSDVPVPSPSLQPSAVSWELLDAPTNRWRFTWTLQGGDPAYVLGVVGVSAGIYLLRMRFWFDDTPDDQPPDADRTLAIRVKQN